MNQEPDPVVEDNSQPTLASLRQGVTQRQRLGQMVAFEVTAGDGRVYVTVSETLMRAIGSKIPLKPDQAHALGRKLLRASANARKATRRVNRR